MILLSPKNIDGNGCLPLAQGERMSPAIYPAERPQCAPLAFEKDTGITAYGPRMRRE